VSNQVINQDSFLLVLLLFRSKSNIKPADDGVHKTMFPSFPEPFWEVAHEGLEEQDKANPLVVGIMLLARFIVIVVCNTRMSHGSGWSLESIRHSESGHNPTLRVDNMGWHSIHNTSNRLTHKLRPCDNHGKGDQQYRRKCAVNPKHGIVYNYLLALEVVLQARQ